MYFMLILADETSLFRGSTCSIKDFARLYFAVGQDVIMEIN